MAKYRTGGRALNISVTADSTGRGAERDLYSSHLPQMDSQNNNNNNKIKNLSCVLIKTHFWVRVIEGLGLVYFWPGLVMVWNVSDHIQYSCWKRRFGSAFSMTPAGCEEPGLANRRKLG